MGPSVCWELDLEFPHSRYSVIICKELMIACTSSKQVDEHRIFNLLIITFIALQHMSIISFLLDSQGLKL